MQTSSAVEPAAYRDVLGHFPTGVVLITAIDAQGQPVGMVVGSFTSVSMEPPLVAFLPMKSSRSFGRIRTSATFCVNVLSAEQEHLCRHFSGPVTDKFAGVDWRPSPSGAPILDGAVAWIDCELDRIVDGGDHHVVFGLVGDLAVTSPVLPLLFFQGGYGRFTPQSLVIPTVPELLGATRLAEEMGRAIDALAQELRAECSLMVPEGGDAVFVAGANHAPHGEWTRLGARYPLLAPLGPLLVGAPNSVSEERWLGRLGRIDGASEALARRQLATARGRDFSILLRGAVDPAEMEAAIGDYSSVHRTPKQERRLVEVVQAMTSVHEPEDLSPDGVYDVVQVSVPVRDGGQTIGMLRLSQLPAAVTLAEIEGWVARLREVADRGSGDHPGGDVPDHGTALFS